MEDSIGDGRWNANHTEFAHTLDAKWINDLVILLNEYGLHHVNVSVNRHVIVLQVRVHDATIAMIDFGRLLKRHADAPDNASDLLTVRCFRVDDLPQAVTSIARVTRT